jgi:hypothetical protein
MSVRNGNPFPNLTIDEAPERASCGTGKEEHYLFLVIA